MPSEIHPAHYLHQPITNGRGSSFSLVRSSKYRHVYGTGTKRDCYIENLRIGQVANESSNLCKANLHYLGIVLDSGGGGSFLVVPKEFSGRVPVEYPQFDGHTAPVSDLDFCPFDEQLVCSASEDTTVMLWKIDQAFTGSNNNPLPILTLGGHQRKVNNVLFHPTAQNVLASISLDQTIKLWDLACGVERGKSGPFPEAICSASFNWNGSILGTSAKDKQMRLIDSHSGKAIAECEGHHGVKPTRLQWLGNSDYFATTGFSRNSERQLSLWDCRNISSGSGPVKSETIDSSAGLMMPFYDADTGLLFLAGKGDGNIRYWEFVDGSFHFIADYKSSVSQKGMAMLPKRGLNVDQNEVALLFKVAASHIERISFRVPRKEEHFQADIFVPTASNVPAISSIQFFEHAMNAQPIMAVYNETTKAWEPKETRHHQMISSNGENGAKMPELGAQNEEIAKSCVGETSGILPDMLKVPYCTGEKSTSKSSLKDDLKESFRILKQTISSSLKAKQPINGSNSPKMETKSPLSPGNRNFPDFGSATKRRIAAESPSFGQAKLGQPSSPSVEQAKLGQPSSPSVEQAKLGQPSSPSVEQARPGQPYSPIVNSLKIGQPSAASNSAKVGRVSSPAFNQSKSISSSSPVSNCARLTQSSSPISNSVNLTQSSNSARITQSYNSVKLAQSSNSVKPAQSSNSTRLPQSSGPIQPLKDGQIQRTIKPSESSNLATQKLQSERSIYSETANKSCPEIVNQKVDYLSVLHPVKALSANSPTSESCKESHVCPGCQAEFESLRNELQALKARITALEQSKF